MSELNKTRNLSLISVFCQYCNYFSNYQIMMWPNFLQGTQQPPSQSVCAMSLPIQHLITMPWPTVLQDTKSVTSQSFCHYIQHLITLTWPTVLQDTKSVTSQSSATKVKPVTVVKDPQLLMACCHFDLSHCGYFNEKDIEDLLCSIGLCISRAQVRGAFSFISSL